MQNGIVLITVFKENLWKEMSLAESLRLGVASRVRPVVIMTYSFDWSISGCSQYCQRFQNAEAAGHRNYRQASDGHGAYFPTHLRFFLP